MKSTTTSLNENHSDSQCCQVCGSASIFADEVSSPGPKSRSVFLNECKRCHHLWTGASAASPAISLRSNVRFRPAAVRVGAENERKPVVVGVLAREVALAS